MTSVIPVTPETVTLWPEMFAIVTLLRWMYLRKTSAFRLARVQACRHRNKTVRGRIIVHGDFYETHMRLFYVQFRTVQDHQRIFGITQDVLRLA